MTGTQKVYACIEDVWYASAGGGTCNERKKLMIIEETKKKSDDESYEKAAIDILVDMAVLKQKILMLSEEES